MKAGLAVNPQYVGWGIGLADLDNDGLPDILQVNGHVYPELEARMARRSTAILALVYRNLGNGKFEDVSELAGSCDHRGRIRAGAQHSEISTMMETLTCL